VTAAGHLLNQITIPEFSNNDGYFLNSLNINYFIDFTNSPIYLLENGSKKLLYTTENIGSVNVIGKEIIFTEKKGKKTYLRSIINGNKAALSQINDDFIYSQFKGNGSNYWVPLSEQILKFQPTNYNSSYYKINKRVATDY
jgi:hypothetical protein